MSGGRNTAARARQQSSAPKGPKVDPKSGANPSSTKPKQNKHQKPESKTETKPTSAPKPEPKLEPKTARKPMSPTKLMSPKKPTSAAKPEPKLEPKTATKPTSPTKPMSPTKPVSPKKPTSAAKPEPKLEPKTEAKPTSAFPGQPLDKNTKIEPSTHEAFEDTTIVSTALPVEDTSLRFERVGSTRAPSAFGKADRGYQSAGFRKKNKDISAGPAFVGFHLGKRATSPSKIEGPNWLKKATEKMGSFFKSQKRNLEPVHASPVCKLTKNIVKEVCAVQQGETPGLQKSVITNVSVSHGFPGISFVTHGQGDNLNEQFPNAFPQQRAEENMDSNTVLLCRPPSGRGEQIPTNEPVDEVEPDPWPKKRTINAAGQVDEVESPNKMSRVNPSPSTPPTFCIGELSKASYDENIDW